ncbi:GDSL esterase/lipase CPRD49-like [Rutidosis leptorrhynchoides]|uniref:GDSL esterase/lipase CPRD49-like n=1 Tax=Rutidosis leptorrhynchoides TaxID=125765 RepID=UPI003A998ED8
MVGPRRPQFVLFGSSIVQVSFGYQGWGAILAHSYARKVDIFIRGYVNWNSRQAVQVLDQVFPQDDAIQPSLVIVYFGGNDSESPRIDGLSPHVPLSEYVENMRKIAIHLQNLSDKPRILFLTAPPVNEARVLEVYSNDGRKNELCKKYADACEELCREMEITVINLYNLITKQDDWMTTCFVDGMHLSATGSTIVADEIQKILSETNWKPSLHWESLPTEFS